MSQALFSQAEWRAVFRRQRSSGLSVLAFCRQERIPSSSFFNWRRKLQRVPGFAEVKLAAEPESASAIELQLAGGRTLRVRPGFCRRTLLELLATLESCAAASEPQR